MKIKKTPIKNKISNLKDSIKTYDVVFHDSEHSNNKGFSSDLKYCKSWIKQHNRKGSNYSYFQDYKGGIVTIICEQTGDTVYTEIVK